MYIVIKTLPSQIDDKHGDDGNPLMTFIHTHKSHVDNPWSVWDYRGPGGGGGGLYTISVTTWYPLPTDQQLQISPPDITIAIELIKLQ